MNRITKQHEIACLILDGMIEAGMDMDALVEKEGVDRADLLTLVGGKGSLVVPLEKVNRIFHVLGISAFVESMGNQIVLGQKEWPEDFERIFEERWQELLA